MNLNLLKRNFRFIIEFLQLKSDMFMHGIEWSDSPRPYRIATTEKALLDTFYIATRRGRRFASLPELHLQDTGFSPRRYRQLMKELRLSPQIATAMRSRIADQTIVSAP